MDASETAYVGANYGGEMSRPPENRDVSKIGASAEKPQYIRSNSKCAAGASFCKFQHVINDRPHDYERVEACEGRNTRIFHAGRNPRSFNELTLLQASNV